MGFLNYSVLSGLSLVATFLLIFFFVYGLVTFCYRAWQANKKWRDHRKWMASMRPTGIQFWKE